MGDGEVPHDDVTGPAVADPGRDALRSSPPSAPVRHRPWSTVLLGLHTIFVAAGAALLAMGVAAYLKDARAPSPEDGGPPEAWGAVIGAYACLMGVVVVIPTSLLARSAWRGRRAADQGSPGQLRRVATITLVIAGIAVILCLVSGDLQASALGLVLAGPYAASAITVLVALRSPRGRSTAPPVDDTTR